MYRNLNQENLVWHGTIPLPFSTLVSRIVCDSILSQYAAQQAHVTLYFQLPGLWMCVAVMVVVALSGSRASQPTSP